MEQTPEAFGSIEKYKRVSAYLGISADALLRNDFSTIPMEFFEKLRPIIEQLATAQIIQGDGSGADVVQKENPRCWSARIFFIYEVQ